MHDQRPDSRLIERPDASLTMENLVRTRALDAIKSGDIECAQGMVLDANDHALEELGMRRALRSLPVPLRRLMATADGEVRLSAMLARAAAESSGA